MAKLRALPKLRSLTIVGAGLTDDGLANLSEFHQLNWFDIADIADADSVTDGGLKSIAGPTTRT